MIQVKCRHFWRSRFPLGASRDDYTNALLLVTLCKPCHEETGRTLLRVTTEDGRLVYVDHPGVKVRKGWALVNGRRYPTSEDESR